MDPIKTTIEVNKDITLISGNPAKWEIQGRDDEEGTKVTLKFDNPGVRKITALVTYELTVTPATTPPPPSGTVIRSGGDVRTAVAKGGTVLLERGGTYSGDISISKDGTQIVATGTGSPPRIKGKVHTGGKDNLRFEGIQPNSIEVSAGSENISIHGFRVIGAGGNGINILGVEAKRCKNVRITDTLVANCYSSGKSQGIYAQFTDGLVIDGIVLDGNGWKRSDPTTATELSHNIYVHASCGPAVIRNVVCANASATGIQARSGGTIENIIFIDCPVGMTYGYIVGSPVHKGGVSGTIDNIVYIGGRDIKGGNAPGKRGWALNLDNIKSARVTNVIVGDDNQNNSPAIHVGGSRDLDKYNDPGDYVGIKDLKVSKVFVGRWTEGAYEISDDKWEPSENPIKLGNVELRKALGERFMDEAYANPATAATTGLRRIKSACGL
jgi:hypothetical protein